MKSRFGCLALILAILLMLSMLLNLILGAAAARRMARRHAETPREFEETTVEEGSGGSTDKVAVIPMTGLISSSVAGSVGDSMVDDMKLALKQAVADDHVKAIVLNIDSPGGEVTAADTIYNAVKNARAKKPVVVYMGSVAASGGYYVACGGSYLMANETTITGSIGVIIETLNYEQLMGKIGVQAVVFKSGKFKDILSGSRPMTPEEQELIQNLVMETYGKFVGVVSSERKIPTEKLVPPDGIADGRIISGTDAVGDKLIDRTGQMEDAFAKAKELGQAPEAAVVEYKPRFALERFFKMLGEAKAPKIELSLPEGFSSRLEPGRLYLLPGI